MQRNNTFWVNKIENVREGHGFRVSKRLNERFLDCYMTLDRLCCSKLGIAVGGVTEYINRLNNVKNAHGRDAVLSKLVRYRSVRNKFAHEAGALKRSCEISRADIKWIKCFNKELVRKRDPLFAYLRSERKHERRKLIRRIAFGVALGTIAALALVLYFVLQKG